MKKLLYLCVAAALFASCKSATKSDAPKGDTTALPLKASYSSSWAISDSTKNEVMVLQSYKDWQDGKVVDNAANYFADTVEMDFPDGSHFKGKRDSLVNIFKKYRDSISSVKLDVLAAINLHSVDKNTDWVGVWYKETDTFKNGKVDSGFYQDDNNVVKGKIAFISSKLQKLKPMKK